MPARKTPGTSPREATAAPMQAEEQLASFIAKFEPRTAELIRACRAELKSLLPAATELAYDNYNFFVIGYCSSERPSDCIVSIAAAANGVGLSFYNGAALPDPDGILEGSGKQNRFIRLPFASKLREPAVVKLIDAAMAHGRTKMPSSGGGRLVIKSVSAKQRPRQRPASAA